MIFNKTELCSLDTDKKIKNKYTQQKPVAYQQLFFFII